MHGAFLGMPSKLYATPFYKALRNQIPIAVTTNSEVYYNFMGHARNNDIILDKYTHI